MKECSACKRSKSFESFYKRKVSPDGLTYKCKDCTNKYSKKHYGDNRGYYLKKAKKNNQKYKDFWTEYFKSKSCLCCGETESCTFDFHHLDPREKEYNISNMLSRKFTKEKVLKEIDKCVLLCSNCHRKVHAKIINLDDFMLL